MIEPLNPLALWALIKHASRWLTNLSRAKSERRQASIVALRKVVIAARRTAVYVRQLNDTKNRHYATEAELSVLWTELSFALEDLQLNTLAKRCLISGKHWADPAQMDEDFLIKADIGLTRIEQLANQLISRSKK